MRCLITAALFIILGSVEIHSQDQDSLAEYLRFQEVGNFEFFFTYFPPFFIQNTLELKEFVRSNAFKRLRDVYGDLQAVDAIYIRSMALTKDNSAISLLLAMVACFDHRLVGLKIPVFSLFFPLTNESEDEFNRRVDNLPVLLYDDTPKSLHGDRDKLQHFFGSAFISNIFESSQPAARVAQFIEFGEEAIIVEGAYDERDLRSNYQGGEFGLALLRNNHRLPSEFLRRECSSDTSGAANNGKTLEYQEQE
jgi:hypothetical protein